MPEDSLVLREKLVQLKKDILSSKHIKETMDNRIKELSQEEIRYIEEIPVYKRQAEEERIKLKEESKQTLIVSDKLNNLSVELQKIKYSIIKETSILGELKNTQQTIIKETSEINLQIKSRHAELKDKEKLHEYNINKVNTLERINDEKNSELNKRELDISNKEKELDEGYEALGHALELHSNNISIHAQNVRSLQENRKFHIEDEQTLRDKLGKADKLVKDQIDIKVNLTMQVSNLEKEIEICKQKQTSLDRHLADLVNQENILKIKELKIIKMAHDAGLRKELKELEESIK